MGRLSGSLSGAATPNLMSGQAALGVELTLKNNTILRKCLVNTMNNQYLNKIIGYGTKENRH